MVRREAGARVSPTHAAVERQRTRPHTGTAESRTVSGGYDPTVRVVVAGRLWQTTHTTADWAVAYSSLEPQLCAAPMAGVHWYTGVCNTQSRLVRRLCRCKECEEMHMWPPHYPQLAWRRAAQQIMVTDQATRKATLHAQTTARRADRLRHQGCTCALVAAEKARCTGLGAGTGPANRGVRGSACTKASTQRGPDGGAPVAG